MLPLMYPRKYGIVALRKESVDRNEWKDLKLSTETSRSPQGERG